MSVSRWQKWLFLKLSPFLTKVNISLKAGLNLARIMMIIMATMMLKIFVPNKPIISGRMMMTCWWPSSPQRQQSQSIGDNNRSCVCVCVCHKSHYFCIQRNLVCLLFQDTFRIQKVGMFKGFCHFPCFQTLKEKVGRLECWNSCTMPPILAQFDRAERHRPRLGMSAGQGQVMMMMIWWWRPSW